MNPTLEILHNRKSIRAYRNEPLTKEEKQTIIQAALRSPTAGNLMLYSIIDITQDSAKTTLAKTCDNQPFIAKAPFVLLFLADYQRWMDYFDTCDLDSFKKTQNLPDRTPDTGDLFLACCDALIAAQTAVIAAESIGVGSCYIGDIMENYEVHRDLFRLPRYVFPISLVCFGKPTEKQIKRELTQRFDQDYICFKDTYRQFDKNEFKTMFDKRTKQTFGQKNKIKGAVNFGQYIYNKKFTADFTYEMSRSVNKIIAAWTGREA